jgi:putative NADH-flavin reductase
MKTLVVGASGATGKLLVAQMLNHGQSLVLLIRAASKIPDSWYSNDLITIIRVNEFAKISLVEIGTYLDDCDATISCLGHEPNLKGIYKKPRRLVTNMVQLICEALVKKKAEKTFRFILMNTAGNSNRDLAEPISFAQKILISLLRFMLPPHTDNENATDYLRLKIGQQNHSVEWVVVRPDSLIDTEDVTAYSVHTSPVKSAIFNPGQTSRVNVAHFMTRLITDRTTWEAWKGQMPVLYNQ